MYVEKYSVVPDQSHFFAVNHKYMLCYQNKWETCGKLKHLYLIGLTFKLD